MASKYMKGPVTPHWGGASHSHSERLLPLVRMPGTEKTSSVLAGMWRKGEPLCTPGRNVKPIFWRFLTELKTELPIWPSTSRLVSEGNENRISKELPALPGSERHYSQQPRFGNNPSVHHPLMDGWMDREVVYIRMQRSLIRPPERRTSCHLWQHGWPWGH